jgi:hypothetical protein
MIADEQDTLGKPLDPAATDPETSESEYKVGPGHPPLETRFKKGCPSPYPKGRPRKSATMAPDLKKALEDALNKKVRVKRGEAQVLLSKATLGIEQLANQFAKGDRHARRDMMDMADRLGVDLLAGQKGKIQEAIQPSHQAILDAYLARQPQPAPTIQRRVNAPNELRDGLVDLKATRRVVPPLKS